MRTCDKCKVDIMTLPLMVVIDHKEYDFCEECGKWFQGMGAGRPEHQATVRTWTDGGCDDPTKVTFIPCAGG